ncbi:MAG: serine/threonine protein kinase, partial [Planctomycetales bacterium]|nr:serine/threonine protein kinase [Planctomycetales bacterium]
MSTPNHDPNANLLFGILALQNDFVSREDFLAASSRWMQDKSRALSDILVEIGALSSADHALLKPLVERHIQAHGGDATVSLRNLSSLGPLGDELRTIVDSEVEASLAVVGKDRSNRDYHATIPPSAGATTSTGSRFRVLRPHKGGGLGFVSVAYDDELHREVALKQIREKYADHVDQRSRFLLEAEITGGLEHPAIVPVYGLGHYPDGRPFYAMKFVRGDNLKDAVQRFHASPSASQQMREGGVELRKLLERFLDVCDAVHYAHSRGVLHRDLKPGNVMLGNYGETLVVDWGLAKPRTETPERSLSDEGTLNPPSASGTAAELPGQVVGTPEYMPPEQAEGQLSRMDARSDVYSLGATLYYLLVNQPPFSDPNVEVVLEKVRRGELKPPREINPQVPQALE